jgi:putative toxin-antitoxin system antitoxin component (TIGR02293 family)
MIDSAEAQVAQLVASLRVSTDGRIGAKELAAILDQTDSPMAVVTSNLQLVHANKAGHQELEGDGHLRLNNNLIAGRSGDRASALRSAVDEALTRGLRSLVTIGAQEPRTVAVVPIASGAYAPLAVLLFERTNTPTLSINMFARAHGLTHAESNVLEALAGGSSPIEVARRAGVAISTVRTQIASIRDKTSSASVRELLHRVSHLPHVPHASITEHVAPTGPQPIRDIDAHPAPAVRASPAPSPTPAMPTEQLGPHSFEVGDDEIAAAALWLLGPSMKGLVMDTKLALHDALTSGLSIQTLDWFRTRLVVWDSATVERILDYPLGAAEGVDTILPKSVGQRLWHLAEALARASSFLGSQSRAESWLLTPAVGLNGRKPVDMLSSSVGIMLLDDFLRRIEYGVLQ